MPSFRLPEKQLMAHIPFFPSVFIFIDTTSRTFHLTLPIYYFLRMDSRTLLTASLMLYPRY